MLFVRNFPGAVTCRAKPKSIKTAPPLLREENTGFSSLSNGGAVLIDFGLARQVTAPGKLRTNSNSGTECYAPIELLEKRAELGAYTDVYSLAATLYDMLTGELPFPSQFRKQNIALTPPKQHNDKISDRVNAAIMKGWSWNRKIARSRCRNGWIC